MDEDRDAKGKRKRVDQGRGSDERDAPTEGMASGLGSTWGNALFGSASVTTEDSQLPEWFVQHPTARELTASPKGVPTVQQENGPENEKISRTPYIQISRFPLQSSEFSELHVWRTPELQSCTPELQNSRFAALQIWSSVVFWSSGVLQIWSFANLECWFSGIWSFGNLEFWKSGVLDFHEIMTLELTEVGQRGGEHIDTCVYIYMHMYPSRKASFVYMYIHIYIYTHTYVSLTYCYSLPTSPQWASAGSLGDYWVTHPP